MEQIRAVSSRDWFQKENLASTTICSLSLIVIGILMIFGGALTSFIYFTEIVRPNYDANYQRYVSSSLPRISGILLLMAGIFLFLASSIFLVYAHYRGDKEPREGRSNLRDGYYI